MINRIRRLASGQPAVRLTPRGLFNQQAAVEKDAEDFLCGYEHRGFRVYGVGESSEHQWHRHTLTVLRDADGWYMQWEDGNRFFVDPMPLHTAAQWLVSALTYGFNRIDKTEVIYA